MLSSAGDLPKQPLRRSPVFFFGGFSLYLRQFLRAHTLVPFELQD